MPKDPRQTTLTKVETPKPRKREQQPRQSLDDGRPKRMKKPAKPPAAPKTKGKGKKKVVEDTFDFQMEALQVETPKLPKAKMPSEDEMEISSLSGTDGLSTTSESTASEGIVSTRSVSIRKAGDMLKIPDVPRKKTRAKKAPTKGGEAVMAQYMQYVPRATASWQPGQSVPYSFLSDTFEKIEQTTKRLEIVRLLVECFRTILDTTPDDLLPAVYLCVNQVGPAHEGMELGIGDAILVKALANVSGSDVSKIKKQYDEDGDLGSVAVSRKGGQHLLMAFASLSIHGVFKDFLRIAKDSGEKSQERKRMAIEKLLNASKGSEAKFITRSLQGKLRIGLAEMTVLQAIAQAFFMALDDLSDQSTLTKRMEGRVELVKQVYSTCPSYQKLIECLMIHGLEGLDKHVGFTPGIPIQPMLAKPTTGISEILQKFDGIPFTCEFKYDGERSQIHVMDRNSVAVYTRNAENVTGKYPDIVKRVPKYLKPEVESIVLDCESVAFDVETNKILPFQRLSTRARKDVTLSNIKVQVCIFCFDCLYLNGVSLLSKPLTERREALYSSIETEPGIIQFAEHQTSNNVEQLQEFLDLAVQSNTEGLIVKTLDCTYEPSKRSVNWLKLKKDYLEGVGDSFDLVVIGAWHGKGKRTGVFGSYLLAVYDPEPDEYQSICKIGTGFSEEDLENYTRDLKAIEIPKPLPNYEYGDTLNPDVWFDAKIVWEVKAADMSISPVHKAAVGIIDESKGVSIRFPRLVRVRDDKKATDATRSEQVAQMYKEQGNSKKT